MTVYGGTQKITFGRPGGPDSEFDQKRAAAVAQAQYLNLGIDAVENAGTGAVFMRSQRDNQYGNVNETIGDMNDPEGGFSMKDSPFNAPLEDNTTSGDLSLGTSSTVDPHVNPDGLEMSALEDRLRTIQGGLERTGLNPRSIFKI